MTRFLRNLVPLAVGLAVSAAAVAPASAHHSFAMFDMSKPVVMKATVKDFQWTNPHVTLWVYVEPKPGKEPELWNLELTSPGNLTRGGMNKRTFKPGDKIEVTVGPLRSGAHGGSMMQAVLADGTVVKNGIGGKLVVPKG